MALSVNSSSNPCTSNLRQGAGCQENSFWQSRKRASIGSWRFPMDEIRNRLLACFSAVFPLLSPSELESAESSQIPAWDSVASVTLFATIEEEFATEIDVNNMAEL